MTFTVSIGFLLFCTWSWNIICAADIFTWNLAFIFFNAGQLLSIIYQMRPVSFDGELEDVYLTLFYPFKVCARIHANSPELNQAAYLHLIAGYTIDFQENGQQ
jgi:hypothetical protein